MCAAMAEIVERGYEQATMSRIANRAGASKETLYSWFGDKVGLVTALIKCSGDADCSVCLPPKPGRVAEGYTLGDVREVLTACAKGLFRLLIGEESVALIRAAMTSPELARVLRSSGYAQVGAAVEAYLARLHDIGTLYIPDASEAFGLFYGIVIQDAQIRALLGGSIPYDEARTERAVDHFLALTTAEH